MSKEQRGHPQWMLTLDFFFNKVIPKKFLVMVFATIFCFMGLITGGQWLIIAGAYAGINYGQKVLERLSKDGSRMDRRAGSDGGDRNPSNRGVYLHAEEPREEDRESGELD